MTRDLDLVRDILLFFEQRDSDEMIEPMEIISGEQLKIDGYGGRQISDHVDIMYEAGLLEGYGDRAEDGRLIQVYPTRLTWAGHEFIAAAKNDSVWSKLKTKLSASGLSVPFKLMESFLVKAVEFEASHVLSS